MNDQRSDAEIFRDVALAAIKETWRWRITTIVIIVLTMLFEITGAVSDVWKLDMLKRTQEQAQVNIRLLQRNYNAFRGNQRWDAFLGQAQHTDAIKRSCTIHHQTPSWDNYQVPPPENNK